LSAHATSAFNPQKKPRHSRRGSNGIAAAFIWSACAGSDRTAPRHCPCWHAPGFPGLTVERHLKNFRWKVPVDIAHYRDGFLKAGVPFNEASLAMSGSKRVC
jgi:hypothetical protein